MEAQETLRSSWVRQKPGPVLGFSGFSLPSSFGTVGKGDKRGGVVPAAAEAPGGASPASCATGLGGRQVREVLPPRVLRSWTAARIPELRAASGVPAAARHHLPGCWWLWVTWQRGEKCRARMAPRFPGKSWRQAGRRRREALGRGAGRPRQPASAPSTPHWSRRGEGAGGAALTSLRAVPAREGGAGSRSEPGEAARRREPPHHRRRARLPRLSAVRPAGQGAWRAAAARPEPADASHQGPKPLSSQLPHPRRCLAGPRPPSRYSPAGASLLGALFSGTNLLSARLAGGRAGGRLFCDVQWDHLFSAALKMETERNCVCCQGHRIGIQSHVAAGHSGSSEGEEPSRRGRWSSQCPETAAVWGPDGGAGPGQRTWCRLRSHSCPSGTCQGAWGDMPQPTLRGPLPWPVSHHFCPGDPYASSESEVL
nr:uncharacterized protein LOC108398179 [Manis javanica]